MSRDVRAYVDRVVAASVPKAAKALVPVLRGAQDAIESADGYEQADAALRRLERSARASELEPILVGAMSNGTSVGSVQP